MTNTKELITKLKQIREEKGLSINDILKLIEANNDYVSKTTITRVFSDGSEETSFRYEETLRPIANALLDIDTIEEYDTTDVSAMKTLLQYKNKKIQELEQEVDRISADLNSQKVKSHEKMEKERDTYERRIEFLLHQIELKDKRMDQLLEAVFQKDKQMKEIMDKYVK